MGITFPVKNLIGIALGRRTSLVKELETGSTRRILKIHFYLLIVSLILTFISSFAYYRNFVKTPELVQFVEQMYISINPIEIFYAMIPITIFTYLLFIFILLILSIIFFAVARFMKSQVNLNNSVYALQLLAPFYVIFKTAFIPIVLFANMPLIVTFSVMIFILLILIFIYRASKTFSELSGIATFTFVVVASMLAIVSIGIFYLISQSMINSVPSLVPPQ